MRPGYSKVLKLGTMPPSATLLLPTCRYHATERNLQTEQARVPAIKSDVHSVWLVGTEVWAIDQAATGSVQTYEVFSKCAAY